MYRLKKILAAMLSAVLALSFCACMHADPSSSEMQTSTASSAGSSASQSPAAEDTSSSDSAAIGPEQLQNLYAKAPEYEYMALGYYVSGYDDNSMLRDGYVPYNENFTQKERNALESAAHGVNIRLSMKDATSASEAIDSLSADYSARCEAEGLSFVKNGSVTTADNDTVGFLMGSYQNEAGQDVFVLLYADIRDAGNIYMCAEIELDASDFDDYTKTLIGEVDNIYALTLSNLDIISSL